jgi:putative spermidine/putrescine transport system ATP-binding protein
VSSVLLDAVARRFGATVAVHPTSLEIAEGEFLTLLGPSGCGKTTTLRMIAGFVAPSEGRIFIGGDDVTRLPPKRRSIGMVFQDYVLFPHLTVAENVGFGLRARRIEPARIQARVAELLELIHLPETGERYPHELSGGQQQRVALARAIAHPPRVLLMDEPLGALDLKMREAMQDELRRVQKTLGITTVYVTHDQVEAMNLSDSIAVMAQGRIVQRGSAQQIYNTPTTRFVAEFVGQINFLPGTRLGARDGWDVMRAGAATLLVPAADMAAGSAVTLAVRPQHLSLAAPADTPADARERVNRLAAVVLGRRFFGNFCHYRVQIDDLTLWTVETRPGAHALDEGDAVMLSWRPEDSVMLRD